MPLTQLSPCLGFEGVAEVDGRMQSLDKIVSVQGTNATELSQMEVVRKASKYFLSVNTYICILCTPMDICMCMCMDELDACSCLHVCICVYVSVYYI